MIISLLTKMCFFRHFCTYCYQINNIIYLKIEIYIKSYQKILVHF